MNLKREIHAPTSGSGKRLAARAVACSMIVSLMVFLSGTIQAQEAAPGLAKEASSSYFNQSAGIGIKQATAIVRENIGGRVLSASPRQVGQAMQYRVRVLVNGERVVTVTVDQNGRILRRR